uniref:Trichohyalin-plectin-homology domain-containing protein n=1 Tax=Varanus komodoensis TaxID=61221 RepID=A0A8D2Q358_VARKO
EMESQEETMEDRRITMRARVKQLREQREEARRKLVAEKREQQFRESCEEARTQWSKKHLLEVCEDRLAQLALKEDLKKQKAEEEATFAALWEEDRLAKEKRTAEEARRRSSRDENMINMLNAQRAVAEAQKEEARRLKEEEAKLMVWQVRLCSGKEVFVSVLIFVLPLFCNLPLVFCILQKELLKEQQIYQAYLAQQMEEDKRLEKEMDKLRAEEAAKMWAKRAAKEKALKEARDRLLTEVLDTRRLQIEEKLLFLVVLRCIPSYGVSCRRLVELKEYREVLSAQIDHLKQAREAAKEEERRDYELALEAERLYQQKMADILSRPYMRLKDLHPLRRQLGVPEKHPLH